MTANANDKQDISLDLEMACLDIDERENGVNHGQLKTVTELVTTQNECDNTKFPRRSRRKRISLNCENRRFTTKPKKSDGGYKETLNYYLDKRVKRLPSTLETIFEEPKGEVLMSSRRLKRFIHFQDVGTYNTDKARIKKRAMKAKKIHPLRIGKKKSSLDLLMKKLSNLEENEYCQ